MFENDIAYAQFDNNSLSPGHILVIPKRHVANFFDMNPTERTSVLDLLDRTKLEIEKCHAPGGYNIGVNIGTAAGQNRMHVHIHLIPRYTGDATDPSGGVRCVLRKSVTHAHDRS